MPKKYLTKAQVERMFRQGVLPATRRRFEGDGQMDCPARRQSWNDFIDVLDKSGQISTRQSYSWTQPAWLCGRKGR